MVQPVKQAFAGSTSDIVYLITSASGIPVHADPDLLAPDVILVSRYSRHIDAFKLCETGIRRSADRTAKGHHPEKWKKILEKYDRVLKAMYASSGIPEPTGIAANIKNGLSFHGHHQPRI